MNRVSSRALSMLSGSLALGVLAGHVAAQDIVYSQPQSEGSAAISLTQGNNQFSFANRRRADNFSLNDVSIIETVRFWGGTESDFFGPANLSNVAGFNIQIFSDQAGLPGTLVAEQTVSLAGTGPMLTGENVGLLNASMYQFEASLSTSVQLEAGTQYWISIAADLFNPVGISAEGWQWAGSQVGLTGIASRSFDGNGYSQQPNFAVQNLAFELGGRVVPSPGGAALLSLTGLVAIRRRR